MITLHLEAETLAELRGMALKALDLIPFADVPERPGAMPVADPADGNYAPEEQQEPVQRDKPRRAHRRVRPVEAPVAAPVATPAPDPDPLEEAFSFTMEEGAKPEEEMDLHDKLDRGDYDMTPEEEQADRARGNAVSHELLKREVISSLADMFTAGNVKVVRHVLHKYGRGAKSFPEIDPVYFPEIKEALDRNEAA